MNTQTTKSVKKRERQIIRWSFVFKYYSTSKGIKWVKENINALCCCCHDSWAWKSEMEKEMKEMPNSLHFANLNNPNSLYKCGAHQWHQNRIFESLKIYSRKAKKSNHYFHISSSNVSMQKVMRQHGGSLSLHRFAQWEYCKICDNVSKNWSRKVLVHSQ